MLVKPPMERLLPKVENRYVLAILVAKRARQLVNGAQPLSQSDSPNLVTVACEELGADKIACVKGHVNPYIPLRPEIEAARLAAQAAAEQASTADAIREELDKVASRPAPDADDAALIGEALMKKEPVAESYDEESAQAEADDSDNDEAEENDSSSEIKANLPDQGDAFPFKLAPPVEATEFINQNYNQEAEETEE